MAVLACAILDPTLFKHFINLFLALSQFERGHAVLAMFRDRQRCIPQVDLKIHVTLRWQSFRFSEYIRKGVQNMGKLALSNSLLPTSGEARAKQFTPKNLQPIRFQWIPLHAGARMLPAVATLGAAVDMVQLQGMGVHVKVRGLTLWSMHGR